MRLTLVAAVLGLVGCAGGGSDPGSVVQGLTQTQIAQTQWLFNAETSDLVAADDLQGPAVGYEAAQVRRVGDAIVIYVPALAGNIGRLGGETHPGGDDDQVGSIDPGAFFADPESFSGGGADIPDLGFNDDFGITRFDQNILQALQGEEGFYVFHPGCA